MQHRLPEACLHSFFLTMPVRWHQLRKVLPEADRQKHFCSAPDCWCPMQTNLPEIDLQTHYLGKESGLPEGSLRMLHPQDGASVHRSCASDLHCCCQKGMVLQKNPYSTAHLKAIWKFHFATLPLV